MLRHFVLVLLTGAGESLCVLGRVHWRHRASRREVHQLERGQAGRLGKAPRLQLLLRLGLASLAQLRGDCCARFQFLEAPLWHILCKAGGVKRLAQVDVGSASHQVVLVIVEGRIVDVAGRVEA